MNILFVNFQSVQSKREVILTNADDKSKLKKHHFFALKNSYWIVLTLSLSLTNFRAITLG